MENPLVAMTINLPLFACHKIDRLASYAGLTSEQMTQAIITLQFNSTGWLKEEPEPELKAKKKTSKKKV